MREPLHESELPWSTWYAGTHREIRGKALGDVDGRSKVGVGLLELPPGSDTTPAHYHSSEEEHLFALSGRAVLHLGAREFELMPGSYVRFAAGEAVPHYIENRSDSPFTYLMVGERLADDVVTHIEPPAARA
jgi:uncharacterized cupin superfamily protein